jgi:hypothetical protein
MQFASLEAGAFAQAAGLESPMQPKSSKIASAAMAAARMCRMVLDLGATF